MLFLEPRVYIKDMPLHTLIGCKFCVEMCLVLNFIGLHGG
ncbi:hypothetical protein T12_14233 [Trichinella patagoniensis]|uniref:Uncharacterized protein n=1 Tax=Trichinella patagoniensis TaxID=990121 RepID=A0A0V0Z315_9BILA|nr:hypothetical protein T12_14233 [Trichinella patagoniensis]